MTFLLRFYAPILVFLLLAYTLPTQARQGNWQIHTPENSDLTIESPGVLAIDSAGNVLVGGHYTGINRFDGTTWRHELESQWVQSLTVDRDGYPWTFANGDLQRRGPGGWQGVSLGFSEVFLLEVDGQGTVHAVMEPGVSSITNDQMLVARLRDGEWNAVGLPIKRGATAMALDAANVSWVGTAGNGIFRAGASNFSRVTAASSPLLSDSITSLAIAQDGSVWIGTVRGLQRYRNKTWDTIDSTLLPNTYIRDIAVEPGGAIWVTTGRWNGAPAEGIVRIEDLERTDLVIPPFPTAKAWNLAVDPSGRLWMSITGMGVATYTRAASSAVPNERSSASEMIVAAPNPFSTRIEITLPRAAGAGAAAEIVDVRGNRVTRLADGEPGASSGSLVWDGTDGDGSAVGDGLYFLRVRGDGEQWVLPIVKGAP